MGNDISKRLNEFKILQYMIPLRYRLNLLI